MQQQQTSIQSVAGPWVADDTTIHVPQSTPPPPSLQEMIHHVQEEIRMACMRLSHATPWSIRACLGSHWDAPEISEELEAQGLVPPHVQAYLKSCRIWLECAEEFFDED